MTSQLPELHPSKEFFEPRSARSSLFWLIPVALGALGGVGLAAWTLADTPGAPNPAPNGALAAAIPVENTDHEREPPAGSLDDLEASIDPEEETGLEHHAPETDRKADAIRGDGSQDPQQGSDGAFYVQVASYRTQSDADAHAKALSGRGLAAKALTEGSWHKVQLGPFAGRADAEKARFKLTVHERRQAYVMPRSNGRYHVQVASFATRAEADPVAKRLTDQGHSTKISRIKMGDQRWHCVRIGPFDTEAEARGYQDLVDDIPGTESRVIPFGPPQPLAAVK